MSAQPKHTAVAPPATATLSSKFQISIPKAVREAQGWKPGQKFAFLPKPGGVTLVRVPTSEELHGILKGRATGGWEGIRDRDERDQRY